jgi:outer membrane protein insertion porin family
MRGIRWPAARRCVRAGAFALLALCGAVGPVLAAQAPPLLADVAVHHNYLLTDGQVRRLLGLRRGDPLDEERLRDAVDAYNASGHYGGLSHEVAALEDGHVEVVLRVVEQVLLTDVAFQGNEQFSSRRLAELTAIEPGERVAPAQAREAERRIAEAYLEAGYAGVSVRAGMAIASAQARVLAFRVTEGPRTYVESIAFEGNAHIGRGKLLDQMQSRERGWPGFIWPGWFRERAFQRDVAAVQDYYRGQGFLEAEVAGDVRLSEDMERAFQRITVHEGPLYTVESIAFEGNRLFRDEELLKALPLEPGEPFRPDLLAEAEQAVCELYADQGHWDVTREAGHLLVEEVIPPRGATVGLRFRIEEGRRVYVRRIRVEGLTKTAEVVVRRNLTFYPGQVARASRFEQSENLLASTGYFDPESAEPVQIALEPGPGRLRDAVVRVKEGPTGRLLLTAGVGSESGLLGGITVEEDNFAIGNWPSSWNDLWRGNAFRGAGQRLTISLRAGTERSYYAVAFEEPAIANSEYSLGSTIYSRGIARNEFDETRTGASVTVGQRLSPFLRRYVRAGYESVDVDDVDAGAPPVIAKEDGSHSRPFAGVGVALDRRDNRFMPAEGYYAAADLEGAWGEVDAVTLNLRGEKYWTVRHRRGRNRHVIGVRSRIAMVDAFSGKVPVYERLYAGGFSTLRGFDFEGVSPVDPATESQVGGESMLLGSAEYSLPLSERRRLRLVTFCDAGYVEEDVQDVLSGWDELRLSVGVGIRWHVPVLGGAALEFDLAAPLLKEPDDETQYLHFSLGAQRRF